MLHLFSLISDLLVEVIGVGFVGLLRAEILLPFLDFPLRYFQLGERFQGSVQVGRRLHVFIHFLDEFLDALRRVLQLAEISDSETHFGVGLIEPVQAGIRGLSCQAGDGVNGSVEFFELLGACEAEKEPLVAGVQERDALRFQGAFAKLRELLAGK